jgi:hypothetical protein
VAEGVDKRSDVRVSQPAMHWRKCRLYIYSPGHRYACPPSLLQAKKEGEKTFKKTFFDIAIGDVAIRGDTSLMDVWLVEKYIKTIFTFHRNVWYQRGNLICTLFPSCRERGLNLTPSL